MPEHLIVKVQDTYKTLIYKKFSEKHISTVIQHISTVVHRKLQLCKSQRGQKTSKKHMFDQIREAP